MDYTNQNFILLSGIITEDISHDSVNIPLDNNFTLICNNYQVLKENKITEVFSVSKNTFVSLEGIGALCIKAKGEITLSEQNNFISFLNEISSRKASFTLNIGNQSFPNIILKSYNAIIDSFGITAECNLIFVQISGE